MIWDLAELAFSRCRRREPQHQQLGSRIRRRRRLAQTGRQAGCDHLPGLQGAAPPQGEGSCLETSAVRPWSLSGQEDSAQQSGLALGPLGKGEELQGL